MYCALWRYHFIYSRYLYYPVNVLLFEMYKIAWKQFRWFFFSWQNIVIFLRCVCVCGWFWFFFFRIIRDGVISIERTFIIKSNFFSPYNKRAIRKHWPHRRKKKRTEHNLKLENNIYPTCIIFYGISNLKSSNRNSFWMKNAQMVLPTAPTNLFQFLFKPFKPEMKKKHSFA